MLSLAEVKINDTPFYNLNYNFPPNRIGPVSRPISVVPSTRCSPILHTRSVGPIVARSSSCGCDPPDICRSSQCIRKLVLLVLSRGRPPAAGVQTVIAPVTIRHKQGWASYSALRNFLLHLLSPFILSIGLYIEAKKKEGILAVILRMVDYEARGF